MLTLNRITAVAHCYISAVIRPGDRVVDATAGNGFDTVFLARAVGCSGQVYAFDIQLEALERTKSKLAENNLSERVDLICDSHDHLKEYITEPVAAIIYNLGYLPGGDKTVSTVPETTLLSLKDALNLLAPGGIASITVYPGYERGREERERLLEFCAALDRDSYNTARLQILNPRNEPPELLLIQKQCQR